MGVNQNLFSSKPILARLSHRSDSLSRQVASHIPPDYHFWQGKSNHLMIRSQNPQILAWEWNQVNPQPRQCSWPIIILNPNIKSWTRSRVTMPGLQRSNSCVDIDFTLRRKFKRTAFRYVYICIWFKKLTAPKTSSARCHRGSPGRRRCLRSSSYRLWQKLVLPITCSHRSRKWVSFDPRLWIRMSNFF
jgi:hypothetical protein